MTRHPPRRGWIFVALIGISIAALWLRVGLTYEEVLGGDEVVFPHVDTWYHARLQASLADNFPVPLGHDPYALFPHGQEVPVAPLLDFAVVTTAKLMGGAEPFAEQVQRVSVWFPPLMAVVTVWLVYALGSRLFDPFLGLAAALLAAVYPQDFLIRTQLGAIDHHAAEIVLSSAVLWAAVALLSGISAAGAVKVRIVLLGALLAAYLAAWGGGALLVVILLVWLAVQYLLDVGRGRDPGYLSAFGMAGAVAMVCLLPFAAWIPRSPITLTALSLLAAAPWLLRWWLPPGGLSWRRLVIGGGIAVGATLTAIVALPRLVGAILDQFVRLLPSPGHDLVGEAQSLLFQSEHLSIQPFWAHFGLAGFLFVAGLVVWLMDRRLRRRPEALLFWIWSGSLFLAALGQRRFGYYLAVSMPIMLAWVLRDFAHGVGMKLNRQKTALLTTAVTMLLVLAFAVAGWQRASARVMHGTRPNAAWLESFQWLRRTTPEPFAGGEACYTQPGPDCDEAGYSILAPWYAGYWIIERGRRVPVSNPTQSGLEKASRAYLADAGSVSSSLLGEMGVGYVFVTDEILGGDPRVNPRKLAGFRYLVRAARAPITDFIVAQKDKGGIKAQFYLPAYYRSLLARLYLFGVEPVEPEGPVNILARDGDGWRMDATEAGYAEALERMSEKGAGEMTMACPDPFRSCVPLEAVKALESAFESARPSTRFLPRGRELPALRVFAYRPWLESIR